MQHNAEHYHKHYGGKLESEIITSEKKSYNLVHFLLKFGDFSAPRGHKNHQDSITNERFEVENRILWRIFLRSLKEV